MKNYKKRIQYFIVIVTVLISLLPMMNYKAYMKTKDIEKLFNTDTIEQYFHYSVYKIFNKSYQSKKVIVGKDGMLFLGNEYNRILYETQGLYKRKNLLKDVDTWTEKIKEIQTWYAERGIQFILAIVPNKHTVYQGRLPNWSSIKHKTMIEDVVELGYEKKIHLLSLKIDFMEQNSSNKLYLNTDTHWNNRGSSLAFEKTIDYLNKIYHKNYMRPRYALKEKYQHSGDLARLLKINYLLPEKYEKDFTFVFKEDHEVCLGYIDSNHQLSKCETTINPIVGINRKAQYTINNKALNDKKLLWLCDSFGLANSQLYNMTFQTIWKFHYNHLSGKKLKYFVDKHHPDIVIYQVVERKLFEQNLIKSLYTIDELKEESNRVQKTKIFDIYKTNKSSYYSTQYTIKDHTMNVTGNDPVIILKKVKSHNKNVFFYMRMVSEHNTKLQLLYKYKKDDKYQQKFSYIVPVHIGLNEIKLSIPSKFINNQLRIDPVNTLGSYIIKELSIYE